MATPVTLKELALILNLAPSTVSRALKGHPDISQATSERVKVLARQMQYRPSAMASGLRNRKFYLLAVIMPDLADCFYVKVLKGIVEYAYSQNYKIMVFESMDQCEREQEICFSLQKSGIDGLLIAPSKNTTNTVHFETLLTAGIPLVFFDRMLGNLPVDRVLEDDYTGARLAVWHMIKKGCLRIAHLSASQQWLWAQKRQLGYKQALLDGHFTVRKELIVEQYSPQEIKEIVRNWIERFQIDGIFAINDKLAIQLLVAIRELGYRVPEDIAICGFGDEPETQVTSPTITTVRREGGQMGKKAAELLIRRVEKTFFSATETELLKTELIVRDSTLR